MWLKFSSVGTGRCAAYSRLVLTEQISSALLRLQAVWADGAGLKQQVHGSLNLNEVKVLKSIQEIFRARRDFTVKTNARAGGTGPHTFVSAATELPGGTHENTNSQRTRNMSSRCFCVKRPARFSEEVDFKQTELGDGDGAIAHFYV